jgi:hypothetical protein
MQAPYLDQITCVNRKILQTVDAILNQSSTPPVILIQSDHGDGHFPRLRMELEDTPSSMVRARLGVFAAYYVPGAPDSLFYDGITPVNVRPRVFKFLFGTTFPRLPVRSAWVVDGAPYRLTILPADISGRDSSRLLAPETPTYDLTGERWKGVDLGGHATQRDSR